MQTILFIHGMFLNAKSWQGWPAYFESRGYGVLAPDWPYHAGEPASLRASIDPGLGKLGLSDIVDYFTAVIKDLPQKPIVVGHSMGGITAQILADRGLIQAAVLLTPAPPQGIFSLNPDFIRSNLPVVNPLKGNTPFVMTAERFRRTFCNTSPPDEAARLYEQFCIPETRNAARQATGSRGAVDFKKPHVPFLFISASGDKILPPSIVARNARRYTDKSSVSDYKDFPGRAHFLYGQQGWEEIAAYTAEWLETTGSKGSDQAASSV